MPTPPPTKPASTRIACATHSAPVLRAELEALSWGGEGKEFQEEHPTYLQIAAYPWFKDNKAWQKEIKKCLTTVSRWR